MKKFTVGSKVKLNQSMYEWVKKHDDLSAYHWDKVVTIKQIIATNANSMLVRLSRKLVKDPDLCYSTIYDVCNLELV